MKQGTNAWRSFPATPDDFQLKTRLVNGTSTTNQTNNGYVQVKLSSVLEQTDDNWYYVCDDMFGDDEAKTFCRELGLP